MRVMLLAQEIGMSTEFALQLLNILLVESEHASAEKLAKGSRKADAPWHILKG